MRVAFAAVFVAVAGVVVAPAAGTAVPRCTSAWGRTVTGLPGVHYKRPWWTPTRTWLVPHGCVWLRSTDGPEEVASGGRVWRIRHVALYARLFGHVQMHPLPRAAFGDGSAPDYGPLLCGATRFVVRWPVIRVTVETGHNYPANGGCDGLMLFVSRDGGQRWSWRALDP